MDNNRKRRLQNCVRTLRYVNDCLGRCGGPKSSIILVGKAVTDLEDRLKKADDEAQSSTDTCTNLAMAAGLLKQENSAVTDPYGVLIVAAIPVILENW